MTSPGPPRRAVVVMTHDIAFRARLHAALARAGLDLQTIEVAAQPVTHVTTPPLLVLFDLRQRPDSSAPLVGEWRAHLGPAVPLIMVAESLSSAAQARALPAAGITGYLSVSTDEGQLMPALAPWLYPDNFNRRSHPRLEISLPVSYRTADSVAAALTRNIGSGGMAVRTTLPLAPDTPVVVSVRLPGHADALTIEARVCWREPGVAMGLTFTRLAAEAQAAIDACVGTRLALSGH